MTSLEKHLHIITHDVPWPVDYGGVVDPFYTIKTLHQLGIRIHLHCFTSDRSPASMLDRYCESVTYYKRKSGWRAISWPLPYIVSSRSSKQLITNLQKDSHPILFQGIHCSFPILHLTLGNRKMFVRLFNVEYKYYKNLFLSEKNILKKVYFYFESKLLYRYEKKIAEHTAFFCLSETDANFYQNQFHAKEVHFIPAILPWNKLYSERGTGNFCLYHGNLTVNENEKAALWLLKQVFTKLEIPFVIAGKNPSPKLIHAAHLHTHTCIVENPSEHEMEDLIKKAQINILPSFNSTGVKLKLLHALFLGRHCIINHEGVIGSGTESIVNIAGSAKEYSKLIATLFNTPFDEKHIELRRKKLSDLYTNEITAEKMIRLLY